MSWGHTPKSPPVVDASCLSQWFAAFPFVVDGARYATAEHYMMAEKARLFGDDEALARVLASTTPAEAKAIGRTVRGYDDAKWAAVRGAAVVRGNVAKFGQHPALSAFLRSTHERVLVEAAPRDVVWASALARPIRTLATRASGAVATF
jgi:ribA/ribD-fused uncharacterized protein